MRENLLAALPAPASVEAVSVTKLHFGAPDDEPSHFSFGDRYAWGTKRAFCVIDTSGGKPVFNHLLPDARRLRPIPMPEIDRAVFAKFRALFQSGDRFLLLTEYADRKRSPIYNMFMYHEEA